MEEEIIKRINELQKRLNNVFDESVNVAECMIKIEKLKELLLLFVD